MLQAHTYLIISMPFPMFFATLFHMNTLSSYFIFDRFFTRLCMLKYCDSIRNSSTKTILIRCSIEWFQLHIKSLQAPYTIGSYTCFTWQCCFTQLVFAYFRHSISPAHLPTIFILALYVHTYSLTALFTLWVAVHLCKWTSKYSSIDCIPLV